MWFLSQMVFGLAAAAGTTGPTTIELVSDHPRSVSRVEIQCPDGYRRQQTARSQFSFDDVPEGVCTAVVAGATTARFRPVLAGEQYRCRADAESLFCNADREAERVEPNDVVSDGPPANVDAPSSTVQVPSRIRASRAGVCSLAPRASGSKPVLSALGPSSRGFPKSAR